VLDKSHVLAQIVSAWLRFKNDYNVTQAQILNMSVLPKELLEGTLVRANYRKAGTSLWVTVSKNKNALVFITLVRNSSHFLIPRKEILV
jgi:hypothetical protein